MGRLFPCLRKLGIRFAAYSAMALVFHPFFPSAACLISLVLSGGYLTGKLLDPSAKPEPGSHFDPKWHLSSMYIGRYKATAAAVTDLNVIAEKHGLKLSEVAYRWMQHHSILGPKDHGIILGVSNVQQLEDAITDWLVCDIFGV